MQRADAVYPHNFEIDSEIFKDDESKLKPKPTADIECIRTWLEVRSLHVNSAAIFFPINR